jgi:hypothetical protein
MKSHVTLRGAGDSARGTVIKPARTPYPSICNEFGEVNGICVTGPFQKGTTNLGKPIVGTTVSGVYVRGFSRMGILVYNARRITVAHSRASHVRRYGIVGFTLSGIRVVDDIVDANGQGGIHIGDAANARAVIRGNRVFGNRGSGGIGIYLRSTSHGRVRDNTVTDNCAGIVFANIDPAPMVDWVAAGNTVRANSRACSPIEGGGPPTSGLGMALLGTDGVIVRGNVVTGNRPAGDTPLPGGILVASSTAFGGTDPVANLVRANRIHGNAPADVIYDGSGSGNRFAGNDCGTSIPSGIC